MEEKGGINDSAIVVKADESPPSFRTEAGMENSGHFGGSTAPAAPVSAATSSETKKRRGRPRKHAADCSIVALSPMPISASFPSDYSAWEHSGGEPFEFLKKKQDLEVGTAAQPLLTYPVAESFTPHMIIVNAGEDVMGKLISFSQQRSRAICILAATGNISNVTLRQSSSSGGTLTYEGRFEILSLTGSFLPSDNGPNKTRSGGMSVSLAGTDGRILGGGLAGMLVAASPVQIVVGSFDPGQKHEETPKKSKEEETTTLASVSGNPISEEKLEPTYSAPKPNLAPVSGNLIEPTYSPPEPNLTLTMSSDLAPVNSMHSTKIADVENCILRPGEESREPNHEITC